MIKLIIFDLWNTLVYRDVKVDVVANMPKEFGLKQDAKSLNKIFEKSIQLKKWPSKYDAYENFCKNAGIDPTKENVEKIASMRDEAEVLAKPFKHVEPMLKQLKKQGFKLGLASNSSTFAIENLRKSTDILDLLDFLVFSYEEGINEIKPGLKMFQRALELGKCKPEESIMIGDKIEDDIELAAKLGINGILYKPNDYEQLKRDFLEFGIKP